MPSPVGTFLLSAHNLSAIEDNMVRAAMVMRIMRYVSFQPWGSIRGDGNRRMRSIQRIIDKIWAPQRHYVDKSESVGGNGVMWRPVSIRTGYRGKISIRIPDPRIELGSDRLAWFASRQPPSNKTTDTDDVTNPLILDLTDRLRQAKEKENNGVTKPLEILYDCRFLLRFDMAKMPLLIKFGMDDGSRMWVRPRTKWYWPEIVWDGPGRRVVLPYVSDDYRDSFRLSTVLQEQALPRVLSDWIHMDWIRPLYAQ